jgi:hypothetical protein
MKTELQGRPSITRRMLPSGFGTPNRPLITTGVVVKATIPATTTNQLHIFLVRREDMGTGPGKGRVRRAKTRGGPGIKSGELRREHVE